MVVPALCHGLWIDPEGGICHIHQKLIILECYCAQSCAFSNINVIVGLPLPVSQMDNITLDS